MKFNENLKYLRKQSGLTQEQLAEKLNVSRQAVTKWESGQAMPDVENIKEISYLFSVTVDTLIGDIENKSTLKIKKKIDDIGYFVVSYVILAFAIISSIYSLITKTVENESVKITLIICLFVFAFIIFITRLKKYLKDTQEKIINMKDTIEAKKERKKGMIKKYSILSIGWVIFSFIESIGLVPDGINTFLFYFGRTVLVGIVIYLILFYSEYMKLEKKVKELNKES